MLIQSDYHIHASFYRVKRETDDPGPTAAEQVAAARAAGSVYVGVLEHCNASSKHPFYCLEELSNEYYSPGFPAENVFLGVEADLNDDGSDFCGQAGREKLQLHYVTGSVHCSPEKISSIEEYLAWEHRCIINALKYNPNVDIIGHPFGEGKRWVKSGDIACWHWGLIPENYLEDILHLASETGKALEINRGDFDDPVYMDFLRKMRDSNIIFEVGSDAHIPGNCVKAAVRTQKLDELGFKKENHWRIHR
ncbi:MAG: hypothetical protein IJY46_00760 [Lentisphaeria bacterium]|nr:hypothetical protein [Lentisphaeria bacterium]